MNHLTEAITITALFKTNRFHNYRADSEGNRNAYLIQDYRPMLASVKAWEHASDFYHVCNECRRLN